MLAGDLAAASPVLLCGAKGVGKSTYLRYLVNRMLCKHTQIALLDADVGQSECTPAATVNLVILDAPLFSSPFTHTRTPAQSFFLGEVQPGDMPLEYASAVSGAFEFYRQHYSHVPLLVNTMGWVKGLGQLLLGEVVSITQPASIIELLLERQSNNLDPPIEQGLPLLSRQPPPTYSHPPLSHPVHTGPLQGRCTITKVMSTAHTGLHTPSLLRPAELRALVYTSYFLATGPTANCMHTILEQPTYAVSFSQVDVVMFAQVAPHEALYALNNALVGLSMVRVGSEPQFTLQTACGESVRLSFSTDPRAVVGFGIIRVLDTEADGCFHIITPVPPAWLQGVVTLVCGQVAVPPKLLQSQRPDHFGVDAPYVTHHVGDASVLGKQARSSRSVCLFACLLVCLFACLCVSA